MRYGLIGWLDTEQRFIPIRKSKWLDESDAQHYHHATDLYDQTTIKEGDNKDARNSKQ